MKKIKIFFGVVIAILGVLFYACMIYDEELKFLNVISFGYLAIALLILFNLQEIIKGKYNRMEILLYGSLWCFIIPVSCIYGIFVSMNSLYNVFKKDILNQ